MYNIIFDGITCSATREEIDELRQIAKKAARRILGRAICQGALTDICVEIDELNNNFSSGVFMGQQYYDDIRAVLRYIGDSDKIKIDGCCIEQILSVFKKDYWDAVRKLLQVSTDDKHMKDFVSNTAKGMHRIYYLIKNREYKPRTFTVNDQMSLATKAAEAFARKLNELGEEDIRKLNIGIVGGSISMIVFITKLFSLLESAKPKVTVYEFHDEYIPILSYARDRYIFVEEVNVKQFELSNCGRQVQLPTRQGHSIEAREFASSMKEYFETFLLKEKSDIKQNMLHYVKRISPDDSGSKVLVYSDSRSGNNSQSGSHTFDYVFIASGPGVDVSWMEHSDERNYWDPQYVETAYISPLFLSKEVDVVVSGDGDSSAGEIFALLIKGQTNCPYQLISECLDNSKFQELWNKFIAKKYTEDYQAFDDGFSKKADHNTDVLNNIFKEKFHDGVTVHNISPKGYAKACQTEIRLILFLLRKIGKVIYSENLISKIKHFQPETRNYKKPIGQDRFCRVYGVNHKLESSVLVEEAWKVILRHGYRRRGYYQFEGIFAHSRMY